ncbi:hypothetical protein TSTA_076940 [Talaromyces stipitatus ATCC 10500]|uniref:Uncharacterized protein n=1 Tax=Talaromyces stipitatus (strain ATCC 10500 / CBS 375.48 / QM 6759 / NRRL 1006) TaxID=441959 RepID=B8LVW1_TALSN|nr:uncharacterized protein TSTA_076940 [Talaromyces stipitatus ATCC 10500]EED24327.1 hypothetical protein TSTA_076940 [Talaromyces stipitatus ATCC 10500]
MYFQNLAAVSVALLAGTSMAAQYNGGEIPSNLRNGRAKLRAIDLLSGSSSAQVVTVTPFAGAGADASKVMLSMSSIAKASSSAAPSLSKPRPSSKFKSSAKPSKSVAAGSSSAHRPAQETHAAQKPSTSPSSANDVSVPVQELAEQADSTTNKDSDKPFWSKPISKPNGKPRPNALDFSEAPEIRVDDKDSCSLRC